MNKFNELKTIIKNDSSEDAANKFVNLLSEGSGSGSDLGLKQEDIDLLLRWAVQEQKKNFSVFYSQLRRYGLCYID